MKKIGIEDIRIFQQYYTDTIINSEYQFSTLFIWQHVYEFEYEILDKCLVIFGKQNNGNTQVYFPIGEISDLHHVVSLITNIFGENNQCVNFRPLSENMKNRLLQCLDFEIEVGTKESYSDYLYDYESLKQYSGKVYKKKRHELHRFCARYNYKYESITELNKREVLDSIDRILNLDSKRDEDEYKAYCKLFDNFEQLKLRGGIIRINGIIEAVSVGEP